MVLPLQTPYITPHILHTKYAHGPENDMPNQFLGRDLEHFSEAGFDMEKIHLKRNAAPAQLYEDAVRYEGAVISSSGALINFSGKKTGRSPKDKRIVYEDTSKDHIWWGSVNIKMDEHTFEINRERAIDYLNTRDLVYVFDGFAGWDPKYRIKVRVICARAYHALFMNNMLIRPTEEELENFGEPDFTIYNAGQFPANRFTKGMTSTASVEINFKRMEMVILGTEYAGEMKKGIFSVMHYLQPIQFGQLSLHSSANVGTQGDVTLFFGLSGTGKTTLSADPNRQLIGDDEHVWSDTGVFNIEGGCYAKCINLSREKEPEIFDAIRFGSILENVVYSPTTRQPDYDDTSITENTRCAYPIEYIPNARIPCQVDAQPKNIIMLTCDAYGVLPPVSKLSPEQASYHFLAGYTSKTPGTEDGVLEPIPTFSTCYSAPFIVLHPGKYAAMLAERMAKHSVDCWLINTGWVGGKFGGAGKRCPLKYTRAIVDAVHDGSLAQAEYEDFGVFNLRVPTAVKGVPREVLNPRMAWKDTEAFEREVRKLANMFRKAFALYERDVDQKVRLAGPVV